MIVSVKILTLCHYSMIDAQIPNAFSHVFCLRFDEMMESDIALKCVMFNFFGVLFSFIIGVCLGFSAEDTYFFSPCNTTSLFKTIFGSFSFNGGYLLRLATD